MCLWGKMNVNRFMHSLGAGRTFLSVSGNPESIKKKIIEIIKNVYIAKDTKIKSKCKTNC